MHVTLESIFWILITFGVIIILLLILPLMIRFVKVYFIKSEYQTLGSSSKVRLVHNIEKAVEIMSKSKTGAIITIIQKDNLDNHRTDGTLVDANISSGLLLSIFHKKSPLHDGAVIIEGSKIKYAGTFYKITNKSISNSYGARHRAAMGISEISDSITIIVSEENGGITITHLGEFIKVKQGELQNVLSRLLNIKR